MSLLVPIVKYLPLPEFKALFRDIDNNHSGYIVEGDYPDPVAIARFNEPGVIYRRKVDND